MRRPDLNAILAAPRRVAARHPWSGASALLLTAVLVLTNHAQGEDPGQFLARLAMASGWAVSLCLLGELASLRVGPVAGALLRIASPLPAAVWFLAVPVPLGTAQGAQYALLVAATHLAVSLLARGGEEAFWHWNRALLQRLVESTFFAAVLGGGVSGALAAIEKLFGVDVPGDVWGDVWIAASCLYAPVHFLAGIPSDPSDAGREHPLVLKLFSTRVLLPLAAVYLAILYAYGAKILVGWSLPDGMVSAPILAFAAFGILAQLLLDPLAVDPANRWARLWTRWFHALLLPLCVLLGVAIARRVSDYGLTEGRYAVVVAALWLPLQAAWFLAGRRSLRAIPASLLVLALLCGWGPWGAFDASRRAQVARLEATLASLRAVPGAPLGHVPESAAARIRGAVSYLCEAHRGRGLERWSPSVARMRGSEAADRDVRWPRSLMTDSVLASLGVSRFPAGERSGTFVLDWRKLDATFPPRARLELREGLECGRDFRLVLEADGRRRVFLLDTVRALAEARATTDGWAFLDTSLVIADSARGADLVPRHARFERDSSGWRLVSLDALVLR